MQAIEVRKDWFTRRVSIIAPARGNRPKLIETSPPRVQRNCPFCPGNEGMTPAAQMVAVSTDQGIEFRLGREAAVAKKWNVRVFPNMFPAFSSDPSAPERSYGHHLVVVDSPNHAKDFDRLGPEKMGIYLKVLRSQVLRLNQDPKVNCISVFKNHGEDAGASISHPHTQIIASNMIPPTLQAEVEEYSAAWRRKGMSAIRLLVGEAEEQDRVVLRKQGYVAFVPFAPMSPLEVWLAPEEPTQPFGEDDDLTRLGDLLRILISGVKKMRGNVDYNLYFHLPPRNVERFHWHVEVVPRVNKFGGYELGFGAYIITVSPEDAAQLYRQAL